MNCVWPSAWPCLKSVARNGTACGRSFLVLQKSVEIGRLPKWQVRLGVSVLAVLARSSSGGSVYRCPLAPIRLEFSTSGRWPPIVVQFVSTIKPGRSQFRNRSTVKVWTQANGSILPSPSCPGNLFLLPAVAWWLPIVVQFVSAIKPAGRPPSPATILVRLHHLPTSNRVLPAYANRWGFCHAPVLIPATLSRMPIAKPNVCQELSGWQVPLNPVSLSSLIPIVPLLSKACGRGARGFFRWQWHLAHMSNLD